MAVDHIVAAQMRRAIALQHEAVWLLHSALDLRCAAAMPAGSPEANALRAALAARLAAPALSVAAAAAMLALANRLEREAAALTSACSQTLRSVAASGPRH